MEDEKWSKNETSAVSPYLVKVTVPICAMQSPINSCAVCCFMQFTRQSFDTLKAPAWQPSSGRCASTWIGQELIGRLPENGQDNSVHLAWLGESRVLVATTAGQQSPQHHQAP